MEEIMQPQAETPLGTPYSQDVGGDVLYGYGVDPLDHPRRVRRARALAQDLINNYYWWFTYSMAGDLTAVQHEITIIGKDLSRRYLNLCAILDKMDEALRKTEEETGLGPAELKRRWLEEWAGLPFAGLMWQLIELWEFYSEARDKLLDKIEEYHRKALECFEGSGRGFQTRGIPPGY